MLTRQCTAKAKSTGRRCTRPPIPGGRVCRFHGGAAPQVKAAAELRLARLVDPAIDTLATFTTTAKRRLAHPSVAVDAAKTVLDRTGHVKTQQVHLGGSVTLIDPAALQSLTDEELAVWESLLDKLERTGAKSA